MPFQLSPGVAVIEKDFTSIVPAVSTSAGAFAGVFAWGPVLDPVTITSENNLVSRFGKPVSDAVQHTSSFFTAANFLSYTNNLLTVRVDTANQKNAVAQTSGAVTSLSLNLSGSITGGIGYATAPTITLGAPGAGGLQAYASCTVSARNVKTVAFVEVVSEVVTITTSANHGYSEGDLVKVAATSNTDVNGIYTILSVTSDTFTYDGTDGITNVAEEADTGSTTVGGTIQTITVTEGGQGYASAPSVTFSTVAAGGTAASANAVVSDAGVKIKNFDEYTATYINGGGVVGDWAAKYPGSLGNSLTVSIVDADSYQFDVPDEDLVVGETYTIKTLGTTDWNVVADTSGVTYAVGDVIVVDTIGAGTGVATFKWAYQNEFDSAPGTSAYATSLGATNDEVHVIVIDKDGLWTGTKGSVLEKFAYMSKASDAKKSDGSNNSYKDVINSQSKYIWWMDYSEANWGDAAANALVYDSLEYPLTTPLSGGIDDFTATDGELMSGFEIFANDELYDVALIPVGKASATVAEYVINNVAEIRKDCVVFVSPENKDSGDIIQGSTISEMIDDTNAYRNELPSTSYAVLDSGYKYQYDRYNDKYRFVPLNGDIAGLCARTDYTNDPWYSPGGYNRGQVKNVVKLAINPGKTERDNLYKNGVNPVVNFPGQGVVLFGDKTLLAKPSAFDRINVRRLFIVLEKAIATAAKFQLFEFNDSFTRAQFKNLVEPFLRDVQGRRGIIDFRVTCDDTNNTGEVIDRNEFIADIFIKPARSINFITLNFVAARTSVNFEEIGA
jgi:phage tail sheath protein FI